MDILTPERPANFCDTCAVRNRAICASLDSDEITLLNKIGHRRRLKAGDQLLWEGEEAIIVANVIEGVLKLATQTADGKEQILGLAFSSDFLGRPFGQSTPYGVEALSDAHVCVFQRTDFDRFAREYPNLQQKLLERTLTELDRTRKWMLLLGRMTAEQRLASLLLELRERLGAEANGVVTLPLTRAQMADVLGLTIETVSREFSKLKNAGLIALPSRREVVILNEEALEDRAQ